jgi:uncharacterized caspase-like protein
MRDFPYLAGRYRALLIGNSTSPADEHNLQPLKGPAKDITALRQALVDAATGVFADDDVTLLSDVSSPRALRALGTFFGSANRDDVLLVYFSGHGKLDQGGKLHLCMQDTETMDLLASAVSSTRINEFVEASRARSVAIVLDCCYAGAFRGGDIGDTVSAPGRYVLTSCRSTQLANDATDDNGTSYFTPTPRRRAHPRRGGPGRRRVRQLLRSLRVRETAAADGGQTDPATQGRR